MLDRNGVDEAVMFNYLKFIYLTEAQTLHWFWFRTVSMFKVLCRTEIISYGQ